jgi:hypothetical protein
MKNCTIRVGPALTLLSLLVLAVPGRAQQPNKTSANLVPFKFTTAEAGDAFAIPVNPPMLAVRSSFAHGQSDLLGPFTGLGHEIAHLSADGGLSYVTDGVGVITAANGTDAVFLTWAGLVFPSATPGIVPVEAHVTITGGTGRFVGATGSGVLKESINVSADLSKGGSMYTFEGMISTPKP